MHINYILIHTVLTDDGFEFHYLFYGGVINEIRIKKKVFKYSPI